MVLGRWTDDGLIEVTPNIGDRVVEIADLTGLPVITTHPYPGLVERFGWLADGSGRVLLLTHRSGVAALRPMDHQAALPAAAPAVGPGPAVGRATVPRPDPAEGPAEGQETVPAEGQATAQTEAPDAAAGVGADAEGADAEGADAEGADAEGADAEGADAEGADAEGADAEGADAEGADAEGADAEGADAEGAEEADAALVETAGAETTGHRNGTEGEPAGEEAGEHDGAGTASQPPAGEPAGGLPLPVQVFADRGAARVARTRISWRRFRRADPSAPALLRRQWRCDGFDCPAFGEHRRIGQPVPRMRGEVPICPRHDQPVVDAGPRRPEYPVSIVVDDLPRRRLVVQSGQPVQVGRTLPDSATFDLPEVVSVGQWLHEAAAAWVSPVHLRLEATEAGLVVTDVSENGSVLWRRKGPDDPGTARPLHGDAHSLGEWDSVEVYTGIELVRGGRRLITVLDRDALESVLVDAPTAAHRQVEARSR
jgi:hypothetical protein